MTDSEILLGLPDYEITSKEWKGGEARLSARCTGPIACPKCGSTSLRDKGRYTRSVRHEDWGVRRTRLVLEGHKWCCLQCGRHFRQRFPGIQPWQRASEAFQK